MTVDEMMIARVHAGARYAELVRELINARVELQALDHVTASPIAGRNHEPGFGAGLNELVHLLAHPVFSPRVNRRLSAEVDERVAMLAASLCGARHRSSATQEGSIK